MNFNIIVCVFFSIYSLNSFADIGEISNARGEVMLNGKASKTGDKLKPGDQIQTKEGKCTLLFGKGSVVHLDQNSNFTVKSFEEQKQSAEFDLKFGKMRALIQNKGSNAKNFRFKTRGATMGVRGTHVYIDSPFDSNQPETFLTIEGVAGITLPAVSTNASAASTQRNSNQSSDSSSGTQEVELKAAQSFQSSSDSKNAENTQQGPRGVVTVSTDQMNQLAASVAQSPKLALVASDLKSGAPPRIEIRDKPPIAPIKPPEINFDPLLEGGVKAIEVNGEIIGL